ncbi:type II toxin-antitoxin system PemK/MazF family toxin [[Clostridium] innocuum]|nr:type II toxin-antitoxin system PemK/MazF family toxin [[Clostridium] innocuum]
MVKTNKNKKSVHSLVSEQATPKKGEIYWIDMPYYSTTVISNIRPCVVLSNNQANRTSKTILVTPITKRLKRPELPCHVTLNNERMVKLEVIIPVEKEKITGYYGELTSKQLREVNQAMLIELGII